MFIFQDGRQNGCQAATAQGNSVFLMAILFLQPFNKLTMSCQISCKVFITCFAFINVFVKFKDVLYLMYSFQDGRRNGHHNVTFSFVNLIANT